MNKKIAFIGSIIIAAVLMTGCCLKHDWEEATCKDPMTCAKCGKTEGSSLDHEWKAATCTDPKTCSVCGATEGEIGSHNVVNGVCTVCGAHFEAFEFNAKSLALDSALAFKFKGYLHDPNPADDAYMEFKVSDIRTEKVMLA